MHKNTPLIILLLLSFCASATAEIYERNESFVTTANIKNGGTDYWSRSKPQAVRGTFTFPDGAVAYQYITANVNVTTGVIQLDTSRYNKRHINIIGVNTTYPLTSKKQPNLDLYFPLYPDFIGPKAQILLNELGDFSDTDLFLDAERSNEESLSAIIPVGRDLLMINYEFVFIDSDNKNGQALVKVQVWEPVDEGYDFSDLEDFAEDLSDPTPKSEDKKKDKKNSTPLTPLQTTDDAQEEEGLKFSEDEVSDSDENKGLEFSGSDVLGDQKSELSKTGLIFTEEEASALDNDDDGLSFSEEEVLDENGILEFSEEDILSDMPGHQTDDSWKRPLTDEQRKVANRDFEAAKSCLTNSSACPAYIDADALSSSYSEDEDGSEETMREVILDEILGPDPEEEARIEAIKEKLNSGELTEEE